MSAIFFISQQNPLNKFLLQFGNFFLPYKLIISTNVPLLQTDRLAQWQSVWQQARLMRRWLDPGEELNYLLPLTVDANGKSQPQ